MRCGNKLRSGLGSTTKSGHTTPLGDLTPREYLLTQNPEVSWLESSLEASRRLKNRVSEGVALGNLGNAYAVTGDTQKTIEYYEQALRIDRETGDRTREGMVIGNLGVAYMNLGETRRALEFYEATLRHRS
jgi:tetratricopeptide (TPR) repeat protein